MNPAEEIVKFWLQNKGYFVQSSIKSGRKEIDILATNISDTKDRKHIEVSVSIRMVDTENTPKTKAQHYRDNNFEDPLIKQKINDQFGGNYPYTKELVVGDVRLKNKDALSVFIDECNLLGINVINFSTILEDVVKVLGTGTQLNSTIKTIQLCKKFMAQVSG